MPRRLSDEDRAAWARVAESVRPLAQALVPMADPVPAAPTAPLRPDPAAPPPRLGPIERRPAAEPPIRLDLVPPLAERLAARPPQLDGTRQRRLARGQMDPEARIDLHGMTRDQARAALTGFLLGARARGERLVLVITGKGREGDGRGDLAPIPRKPGAIRHDLPHWLGQAPLAALVLDVRPAHRRHGGGGAFYVYLRRIR
jgi:DNA-nicking Smr family endonuclease